MAAFRISEAASFLAGWLSTASEAAAASDAGVARRTWTYRQAA